MRDEHCKNIVVYKRPCRAEPQRQKRRQPQAHHQLEFHRATGALLTDPPAPSALTCAFELFNTLQSVFVFPLGPAFVLHHVVTFGLCFISTAPYVHFYALFFFGLANLSSVALAGYTVCEALERTFAAARAAEPDDEPDATTPGSDDATTPGSDDAPGASPPTSDDGVVVQ